jgi:hypothetical protein
MKTWLPFVERVYTQLAIVIPTVASDLFPDEMGLFERLILIGKLHLGNNKSFIVSEKLVNLEGVFS